MEESAFNPKIVADSNCCYTIPIYQRLFAWTEEQIKPLLLDLLFNCIENPDSDYYIGLLTTTNENDLVDGQQRFTVMTLMALVMRDCCDKELWNQFLKCGSDYRLKFQAREEDKQFLQSLVEEKEAKCVDYVRSLLERNDGSNRYYNKAMVSGIICIADFIDNIPTISVEKLEFDESRIPTKECFVRYVYNHLMFFLQRLPKEYTARMLNKYFESMNSSGRNLENHEILKVVMLKSACSNDEDGSKYSRLVRMWNGVSMMDKTIFGVSDENNLEYQDRISRKNYTLPTDGNNATDEEKSIADIINLPEPIQNKYEQDSRQTKFHSFLTFPDFLLQVLYLELLNVQLDEKDKIVAQKFFKREELGNTFKKYSPYIKAERFIEDLYKYRIILDWSLIRIDGEGDYQLLANDSEYSKLEQYEAMLYASTSQFTYYKWVPFVLKTVADIGYNEDELLKKLIEMDNKWHPKPQIDTLDYRNGIDRYYFRRLDYYLWKQFVSNEDKSSHLLPEMLAVDKKDVIRSIKLYKFHQYNSIEHLYPREEREQIEDAKWVSNSESQLFPEDVKNQFGNLALISGSYNSTQGYQSMNHKFVNVKDHVADNRIESIKLVLMYCLADGNAVNWSMELADKHGKDMMNFLKSTYEFNGSTNLSL